MFLNFMFKKVKEYATRVFFTHGGEPKLVTENLHDSHNDLSRVSQNQITSKNLNVFIHIFVLLTYLYF